MPPKIRDLKAALRRTDRAEARYSLVIEWSPDDGAFVVTVPDLPGCRTHGRTYEEAVRQAQDAIDSWIDAARADGQPVPEPRTFARSVA